jgi:hypothetical protein
MLTYRTIAEAELAGLKPDRQGNLQLTESDFDHLTEIATGADILRTETGQEYALGYFELMPVRSQTAKTALEALNDQAIITKAVRSLLSGKWWDKDSLEANPKLSDNLDDTYEMLDEMRDDLPENQQDWDDEDIIAKSKEFKALLTQWASARLRNVKAKLLGGLTDQEGGVLLHRIMRVPQSWHEALPLSRKGDALLTTGAALGRFWTGNLQAWNEEIGSYPIWGQDKPGHDVMIEIVANVKAINWPFTVLANMEWSTGDREWEVRIKPDGVVRLLKLENNKTQEVLLDASSARPQHAIGR